MRTLRRSFSKNTYPTASCQPLNPQISMPRLLGISQGQKDFAACTKPRNFQFSATNRDFLRFPRQIAKFPILRDKSRFFQSSAKNRAFSFKSEDQICAFSFKSEDQICAFSFKSQDQVCVFSIKSAGQMSRFLQVLSK